MQFVCHHRRVPVRKWVVQYSKPTFRNSRGCIWMVGILSSTLLGHWKKGVRQNVRPVCANTRQRSFCFSSRAIGSSQFLSFPCLFGCHFLHFSVTKSIFLSIPSHLTFTFKWSKHNNGADSDYSFYSLFSFFWHKIGSWHLCKWTRRQR